MVAKRVTTKKSRTAKTTKKKKTSKAATRNSKSAKKKTRTTQPKTRPRKSAGSDEVTIDRRRENRRQDKDLESQDPFATVRLERRKKVNRRRQIDPTTCERDYSDEEIEFMNALDDYKRASGRMFPTCSEVLEVVRSLGYVKTNPADASSRLLSEIASNADSEDVDDDAGDSAETAADLATAGSVPD